jgi:tRNA A37 threonylcarbamoyltransferase TsaD
VVSARFHNGVVAFLAEAGAQLAEQAAVGVVALSGGCFQNRRLTEGLTSALEARGFEVLTHSLVPANDGGIALGQAWVAVNRLAGLDDSPQSFDSRAAPARGGHGVPAVRTGTRPSKVEGANGERQGG